MTYDLDLAQMFDPEGNGGKATVGTGETWAAPTVVELDAGRLVGAKVRTGASADQAALEQFVGLAGAPETDFVAFARRWGFLELCSHGLPTRHGPDVPGSLMPATLSMRDQCRRPLWENETVEAWRYWASQARALLRIVNRLRESEAADPRDWDTLVAAGPWVEHWPPQAREALAEHLDYNRSHLGGTFTSVPAALVPALELHGQRQLAAETMKAWLGLAGVGIDLRWQRGLPEIVLRAPGLFAQLGMLLVLAATRNRTWALCASCGTPHLPRRRSSRTYCPQCRASKVPAREAQRALRSRRRDDPEFRQRERERVSRYRQEKKEAAQ